MRYKLFKPELPRSWPAMVHNTTRRLGMAKRVAQDATTTGQRKFVKLSGRDHILQRSDMYCGSLQPDTRVCRVVDTDGRMALRNINVSTAFLQMYEEVLMNAADRVSAFYESNDASQTIQKRTTAIHVTVCQQSGDISVTNNGDGVPTSFDEEQGCHIPELVFGHLRTSSNYNDSSERLNVGRNGIGVKIVNIFSTQFVIETVDVGSGTKYKQKFTGNMSKIHPPTTRAFTGEPYTRVSFTLDLDRFGMSAISDEIVSIMRMRAHEICFCSLDTIRVTFNKTNLKTNTIERYVELLGVEKKAMATSKNERWKVAVAFTPLVGSFRQISFVNSTCTPDGGTHVSYVMDSFTKQALSILRKKLKSPKLKPVVVRDALTLVVSAHIVNPTFSSQTKDKLTLPQRDFGSTFEVSEQMVQRVLKSGLTEHVAQYIKNKERDAVQDNDGRKVSRVKGMAKLHDAKWAGTRNSSECLLIVTEGDSALTFALSAMSVIGRDKFGAFPLRGKLLNVRDAPDTQLANNSEINALKKIIGLQDGVKYDCTSKLRYGGIVLLTDADLDGSHIRGLIINLFDVHWPSLLKLGFVKAVGTPIVKATRGSETVLFYNDCEYATWREQVGANVLGQYKLKYLKGLGSSTAEEARQYFSNVRNSLVTYSVDRDACESMSLAFCKKRATDRKKWLATYDKTHVVPSACRDVSVTSFVNNELKHFSRGDLVRSIPSVVDGLKVSQRKALCGSFMRGIANAEAKVAQLTAFVADKLRYHHGESSMAGTIVGLAQDFVGTNNINLLLPKGQLGSRLEGGTDAASPRYTFVQMNPVASALFVDQDSSILQYTEDEGQTTEPVHYCPIISVLLVNGSKAIATGYSTSIPQFNPADLIENVRKRLDGLSPSELVPYYRGFRGSTTREEDGSFTTKGVFVLRGSDVHISELPVGTWSSPYKRYLESLMEKKQIASYTESCTDVDVSFVVTLNSASCAPVDIVKLLKLASSIKMTNMHAFDEKGAIHLYRDASEIEEAHFGVRYSAYERRKAHMIRVLRHETTLLSEKIRFMQLKVEGKIRIENVGLDDVMSCIEANGFEKLARTVGGECPSFDYIMSIRVFDFTTQNVQRLRDACGIKQAELQAAVNTTVKDMWLSDLATLQSRMAGSDARSAINM